jgi:hypothetical protein
VRTWEDLLQEAILRSCDGNRNCPKGLSVVHFLSGVMRSIRSQWMEEWQREHDPAADQSAVDRADAQADEDESSIFAHEKFDVEEIIAKARVYLCNDENALKYLTSIQNGWKRRECMQQFQWTKTFYETTKRRFKNKIANLRELLRDSMEAEQ